MENQQRLEHYAKLHKLGVDFNAYISSKFSQPDSVTRIVNAGASANLHLHQQEKQQRVSDV